MILTTSKIEEILRIIERNHIIYGAFSIGVDQMNDYEKSVLKDAGIDLDVFSKDYTPFEQSFYFGRLTQVLSDPQVRSLRYADFLKYLERGQYIPLNRLEKDMLSIGKRRSYRHLKDLGRNIGSDVERYIEQEDMNLRLKREKIIGKEMERGIEERKSLSSIVREIGKKTGDWQRNLGRIVDTEYQTIMQEGRLAQIERESGGGALVYRDVYPGACRHCIRLYLTGGIGSKPRVFKLSEVIENGTNIGRKVADWKAVQGSTHPFCRCNWYEFDKDKVWNEETNSFEYPEKYEPKIQRKQKNKTIVGDKVFYV